MQRQDIFARIPKDAPPAVSHSAFLITVPVSGSEPFFEISRPVFLRPTASGTRPSCPPYSVQAPSAVPFRSGHDRSTSAPHKSGYTYNHNLSTLDHSQFIVFPAECRVALVPAELHLLSFGDHLTVQDTGIELCPLAAPADRFDLLDVVRQLHEPLGSGEQMTLKIRPQAIADDGDVMIMTRSLSLSMISGVRNCTSSTMMQS